MSNPSAKPDSDPLAAQEAKDYAEEIQKLNEQESIDIEPVTQLINEGVYLIVGRGEANEGTQTAALVYFCVWICQLSSIQRTPWCLIIYGRSFYWLGLIRVC